MFLFHITPQDHIALDFIKNFNQHSSFEFISYILCSYSETSLTLIKSYKYDITNVQILLYNDNEEMMKFIGSINIKYVLYNKNFTDLWNRINFFNKYVFIYDDDSTIMNNCVVIKNYKTSYTIDKDKYKFTVNTKMKEDELHLFFRDLFTNVNSHLIMDDKKNTIVYIGTNPTQAILVDVAMIAGLPPNSEEEKIEPKVEPKVEPKKINVPKLSQNIKTVNGIYKNNSNTFNKDIEKENIKIAIVGDWITSTELQKLWTRYGKNDNRWDNIILVADTDTEADFYVIINRANFTNPSLQVASDRCIVFHMEPNMEFIPWYREFTKYFTSQDLLFKGLHMYHKNNVDWHLSLKHSDFTNLQISKTKADKISMVMSSRKDNIGHVMRLDLAHKLDLHNSIEVDIYGKCKDEKFKNYKSELPYYCRDEAILPYKYHFMAENNSIDNYFTEKIIDCILGETLCFYWGCNTLERFIDPRCFIRLPLHDIQRSLEIIQTSIANNEWEKRVEIIRKEKNKMLNVYSLMPRVKNILRLNISTNTFILGTQTADNIHFVFKNMLDQSFKNVFYKSLQAKGFDATTFIEMCYMTVQNNKSSLVLHYDNCMVSSNDKIFTLLYDRLCDTVGVALENFKKELLFFFNEKQDPNDILNMDCYITVDIAKNIIKQLEEGKFKTLFELFENIPLIRMKYIF